MLEAHKKVMRSAGSAVKSGWLNSYTLFKRFILILCCFSGSSGK